MARLFCSWVPASATPHKAVLSDLSSQCGNSTPVWLLQLGAGLCLSEVVFPETTDRLPALSTAAVCPCCTQAVEWTKTLMTWLIPPGCYSHPMEKNQVSLPFELPNPLLFVRQGLRLGPEEQLPHSQLNILIGSVCVSLWSGVPWGNWQLICHCCSCGNFPCYHRAEEEIMILGVLYTLPAHQCCCPKEEGHTVFPMSTPTPLLCTRQGRWIGPALQLPHPRLIILIDSSSALLWGRAPRDKWQALCHCHQQVPHPCFPQSGEGTEPELTWGLQCITQECQTKIYGQHLSKRGAHTLRALRGNTAAKMRKYGEVAGLSKSLFNSPYA